MTDVVVVLGSRFADLEAIGTRWAAVVAAWRDDPRVGRLDVVDYPRFGRPSLSEQPSWIDGVHSWSLHVAGRRASSPVDALLWRATGRVVRRALGTSEPLAVAATPLAVPLLAHLTRGPTAFDAVDDWRHLGPAQPVAHRIEAGYAAARRVGAVTAVSETLAERLRDDFGLKVVVEQNGVHLGAHTTPPAASLPVLPEAPFAVYLGSVSDRVDLDLVEAAADAMPVVLAGPVQPELHDRVASGPLLSLGVVPKRAVPALLARAAVGLVLHHVDALTRSMDPMKLSEYEASGLPVVATALPGLDSRPGVVTVMTPSETRAAVLAAAAGGRRAVPADLAHRDWPAVADRLLTRYLASA
ncbi:MAG: hypothetical protein JWO22_3431 [Frankiales bacterium]|nr:hypothetical protein [Frankiales bacterium]